jgi:hypothetical protein
MSFQKIGNEIHFDGVKVGAFQDPGGHLRMVQGKTNLRPVVLAWLEKQGGEPVTEPTAPEPEATAAPTPPAPKSSKSIPPCPPMDPAAGDKTPAVIDWWFTYHPEAAATKYHGRKFTR